MSPTGLPLTDIALAPAHPPGSGRKAREKARRQSEVLDAARALFARKGYQRTPMVEIAAASELALGTLYQLFSSKEAILCSLLENYIDVLITRVRAAVGRSRDPGAQLGHIVRTQLAFCQENADILRFYLSGWTGYEFAVRQRFGERIDTKYEQYLGLLESVFRRGAREGIFVAGPARRFAVMVAGVIHALIRRWLRDKRLSLVAEGDAIVAVILHGVMRATRNGRGRP